ncbi:MAG: TolC family protein [Bacteroidales bacterium]|nr:TolC family protein [Bacteroidales bacterium]
MKRTLITLLLTALAATATAQERPTVHLPLDSCTAWALQHQAALKNAAIEVEMAQETRRAALTKYFPTLYMSAFYFQAKDPLVDVKASENGDKIQVSTHIDGFDGDLEEIVQKLLERVSFDARLQLFEHGAVVNAVAMQPIFAGGRIVNGNRLAELGVQAAELKLAMTTDEVEMNTRQYYWRVVSLQTKTATVQQALQLLDTLEHDAVAAHNAGVIGRNDLLKVRLKKNEMLASEVQLKNGIELATMALCQYVGIPYEEGTEYTFDTIAIDRRLADSPSLLTAAGRKESQLLELGVEASRLQKAMALGEALPQVTVGATYGLNNLMDNGFKGNGLMFATLTVPLTAWWETAHKVRKAELERQQAELKRDDLREQMELQNRQAWNEMNEAYTQTGIRQQAMDDAEDNLKEIRQYYQAGLQGVADLLEAQTLLTQARNEWVDQLITFQLKYFRYYQLSHTQEH